RDVDGFEVAGRRVEHPVVDDAVAVVVDAVANLGGTRMGARARVVAIVTAGTGLAWRKAGKGSAMPIAVEIVGDGLVFALTGRGDAAVVRARIAVVAAYLAHHDANARMAARDEAQILGDDAIGIDDALERARFLLDGDMHLRARAGRDERDGENGSFSHKQPPKPGASIGSQTRPFSQAPCWSSRQSFTHCTPAPEMTQTKPSAQPSPPPQGSPCWPLPAATQTAP